MNDQVRVLIVDDSALMRRMLRFILESDAQIKVVGEAANGREALLRVEELKPSVITMDVRMPVMDGLETTERLMAYHPTPILVITASLSRYDIDITFKMLDAGALDVMEKPRLTDHVMLDGSRRELIRRVKMLARMKVVTHLRGRRRLEAEEASGEQRQRFDPLRTRSASAAPAPAAAETPPVQKKKKSPSSELRDLSAPFPLVVIGASAGGPRVVHQLLMGLPATFKAGIVIVQHIAEGFGEGMAEWLDNTSNLRVHLAQEGMQLAPGMVVVAPDGRDLVIQREAGVRLTDESLVRQLPRPSIDIAMETAAAAFGSSTIGVLLTGMGRDGALGMQRIRHAGGYTYAQDEASSPIYGMPRAAVELGAVDEILTPDEMIDALQVRVAKIRARAASARNNHE